MIAPVKDPAYYGRPRREMRRHVPIEAKLILDIGCGAGAFGAGLKSARQLAGDTLTVWGIEMDPIAAERAGEVLDRVLVGDAAEVLNRLKSEGSQPKDGFDAVVMNDVLEHVLEPEELLVAAGALLRPGGHIVASVPNVRFFGNVVNLVVKGSWEYTDEGILDRTHFRFFIRMLPLIEDLVAKPKRDRASLHQRLVVFCPIGNLVTLFCLVYHVFAPSRKWDSPFLAALRLF